MTKKDLLSIGELAKITKLSIRTLRYYDEIGLLKPRYTDPESGYRYYGKKQLLHIEIIQDLKSFDFSLVEIKEAFKRDDLLQIKNLYVKRRAFVESSLEKLQKTMSRIDKRLSILNEIEESERQIEKSGTFFRVQFLEKRYLLSTRYKSRFDNETIIDRVAEVQKLVDNAADGAYVIVFHENYEEPDNTDLEMGTLVCDVPQEKKKAIRELEAGYYVTTIHKGPHETSLEIFSQMRAWISLHGYEIIGPPLKLYIRSLAFTSSKKNLITEIEIPVRLK